MHLPDSHRASLKFPNFHGSQQQNLCLCRSKFANISSRLPFNCQNSESGECQKPQPTTTCDKNIAIKKDTSCSKCIKSSCPQIKLEKVEFIPRTSGKESRLQSLVREPPLSCKRSRGFAKQVLDSSLPWHLRTMIKLLVLLLELLLIAIFSAFVP